MKDTDQVVSTDDVLLSLPEIAEMTKQPEATWRWKRHTGKAPWIWRSGRILVAWRSDVLRYLNEQQATTSKK